MGKLPLGDVHQPRYPGRVPRRTGPEAERAAAQAVEARWRYLLRHPTFRAGLQGVLELLRSRGGHVKAYEASRNLADKWPLLWAIPLNYFQRAPDVAPDAFPYFEALYTPEPPVWAITEDHFITADSEGAEYSNPYDFGDPKVLYLGIDLDRPRDVLLALIEEDLRKAVHERREVFGERGGRRRLDKVDFYLRVYDLATRGETFSAIAAALGRRPSTVKSAFVAARINIFGPQAAPTKRELPLVGFDPESHFQKCAACKKAERPEEFCTQARAYVEQDYVGRRELPVGRDPLSHGFSRMKESR